jgi:hypothetical protein
MERVAIVVRLKAGSEPRAAELIAQGPPFDLAETGIAYHGVYLSATEVVFVFEGDDIDSTLGDLIDERAYLLGPALEAWRAIVEEPPRIAREHFVWDRDDPAVAPKTITEKDAWASISGREAWG